MSQFTLSSPARPPSEAIRLPLMIGGFLLLWSSAFAVGKLAILDCPPLLLLVGRCLAAGFLMLVPVLLNWMPWRLSRRDVLVFALLGIANQALFLGLGYVGLQYLSAGLSVLIASLNPVVTAAFAALLLGERITLRKLMGLLLGIGGVALVVQHRLGGGADHLNGVLFTAAAVLSIVFGTMLFKRYAPSQGLWTGNAVQSVAAGFAVLPFALSVENIGDVVPSARLAWSFAFLVLFVAVFAYLLWFKILAVSGATAAASYHFLTPPLGVLFGWLILDEHVSPIDLIGIMPVILGIYLVTRSPATGGMVDRRQARRNATERQRT
jgi:drug/metabolite transporter (DMT)-like permease